MKITGISGGIAVAVLFLNFVELPFPADLTADRASVDWAVTLGIFLGGAISGLLLDNVYATRFSLAERFSEHETGTRIGCLAGGLLGLLPAFILGVGLGGTLGGGVGSVLWNPLVPFGIGFGIIVVVILLVTITSLVGSILGSFAQGLGRRG